MMYLRRITPPLLLFCAAVSAGCGQNEPVSKDPHELRLPCQKAHTRVYVTEEVEHEWKSVQIAVLDRETGSEDVYTVDIGSTFYLKGADLELKIENFLPTFVMDGSTITSAPGEPRNPAALLTVREGKQELFRGWLFNLYPEASNFDHPRYNISLSGYLPKSQKKG